MTSRNLQIDSRHHHSRIFKIFKCNFYHSKSSCPSHSRSPASADNCMARWKSSLRSDMAKQRSNFNGPLFRPKKPSWIGSKECKVSHRKMTNLFSVRTEVWWSVVWCAVCTVGSFLSCVLLLQSSRIEHDKRGSGRNQFPNWQISWFPQVSWRWRQMFETTIPSRKPNGLDVLCLFLALTPSIGTPHLLVIYMLPFSF